MTDPEDRTLAWSFNRRAFIGGAAGTVALPFVAKAAGDANTAAVAADLVYRLR
jgi:hypothetical protein